MEQATAFGPAKYFSPPAANHTSDIAHATTKPFQVTNVYIRLWSYGVGQRMERGARGAWCNLTAFVVQDVRMRIFSPAPGDVFPWGTPVEVRAVFSGMTFGVECCPNHSVCC